MKFFNLILAVCFLSGSSLILSSCNGDKQTSDQESQSQTSDDEEKNVSPDPNPEEKAVEENNASASLEETIDETIETLDAAVAPRAYKSIPSAREIEYDLIGHSISEGTPKGYHSPSWKYIIESGDLSDFQIDEVLRNDGEEYSIIASFNLKGGKNYHYYTKARISYDNTKSGWVMESIFTLEMEFVVSDDYDFAVRREMDLSGNALNFYNMTEDSYSVMGEVYDSGKWRKFLFTLSPGNYDYVYGRDFQNIHVLNIK